MRDDLIKVMRQMAGTYLGISIPAVKEELTLEQFMQTRLGLCRLLDLFSGLSKSLGWV